VIGICIVTTVFAVIWPESTDSHGRERLAACLLRLGGTKNGSQNSNSQREQFELEIASRLSEVNSFEEESVFEELIQGEDIEDQHRGKVSRREAERPFSRDVGSLSSRKRGHEVPAEDWRVTFLA
jgi:hypothetical protein